jgi:hypothetical protein
MVLPDQSICAQAMVRAHVAAHFGGLPAHEQESQQQEVC